MKYRIALSCFAALMLAGCPGTRNVRNTNNPTVTPPPRLPPIPPKLVWNDGSPFAPTRELTTCTVNGQVYRIFLPDNRSVTRNLYYFEPVLSLQAVDRRGPRPPSEFTLTASDLSQNAECKKRICDTQGVQNCTVVLSPLPISIIEIGPASGVENVFMRGWRKIFRIDQRIQSGTRVVLRKRTMPDTSRHCPLPLEIKYRYRAFAGSVAPQLVIDLYSIANSTEFQRLSQKVQVGSGNTPTLVAPHQIQNLITRQSTNLTRYTINLFGEDGSSQPFVAKLQGLLADGMENILQSNLAADQAKLARMSRELISGMDFQRLPDIINQTVNAFNSARTSRDQRTAMSHRERWDFFSVVAKGALEYLGLKDQPAKWTKDEWNKFIHATKTTFNWQRTGVQSNTWRIRAINLMRLVVSNQVRSASVRTAKFNLSSFSYQEATYAVNVRCKCIPRDGHCDAGCETFGTSPQDDCGWCRQVCRPARRSGSRVFCIWSENRHNRGHVIRSGNICFPPGYLIAKANYFCNQGHCPWSYNPSGGYHANYRYHTGNRCIAWTRKWDGRPARDCYRVYFTAPAPPKCTRVCTRR